MKMKGDYLRSLAESPSSSSSKKQIVAEASDQAYTEALEAAKDEMQPDHPLRLELALNYSTFCRETLQAPEKASRVAKEAFDDAISQLDTLSEESYKDSTHVYAKDSKKHLSSSPRIQNHAGGERMKCFGKRRI